MTEQPSFPDGLDAILIDLRDGGVPVDELQRGFDHCKGKLANSINYVLYNDSMTFARRQFHIIRIKKSVIDYGFIG